MSKTSSKNRKLNVTSAKTVTKRVHQTMKAFSECEDFAVRVEVNGVEKRVKSNAWYVVKPAGDEGSVGFQRVHCLVKKGVALFATEKNFMRPRMYKPVSEVLEVGYTIERTL